jgi:putative Mg2+ transporter-C (MgtC) family protein
MFVLVPQQAGMSEEGISRVIQGLLAGIGFLGAGTILHLEGEHKIKGLTTAAGIWFTAGIGIAVGIGREATAVLSTLLALVIIGVLPRLERALRRPNDSETKTVKEGSNRGRSK